MKTLILKFKILLILQNLGTKCNVIIQNTTLFVDNGATLVLNCTCFRENESSWNGPDTCRSNALSNETLITYSNGLHISPNMTISNIDIYGNYTIGKCHLKIHNFSKTNDGIYQCSYFYNGSLHVGNYKIYSKRPPTNLKIINVTEKNITYGQEGVQMNLTCTVNNGIPSSTLIWSIEGLAVSNGSIGSLLYQLTPTRFDHLKTMTCNASSDLLTSPLSQTTHLDIQYKPYLTTTQLKDVLIIEGQSTALCCHSNSNPAVFYISWEKNYQEIYSSRQNNTTELNGMKDFCLPIGTVYRNHTGNYTCVAENSIAKSNSSLFINVLYPPDVKVTSTISEQSITLQCGADGRPDTYTFYDWEHKSEFNEHIRRISGTQKGQLVIDNSQKGKENENDGIYICTVSNGISNRTGNTKQKGQSVIMSHAPPVFVADNKPVQNGQYRTKLRLKIHIYDNLCNRQVFIKINDTTLKIKAKRKKVLTYDIFHEMNITVRGQQYTFDIPLISENDFRNYTVEACNEVGCNSFDVQVKSAYRPEPPTNISVIAKRQTVTVLWCASFNGGFDQYFFLEYTIDLRFEPRVIGPVHDTNEKEMNYTIDELSPNTAYYIRLFSRNKIGESIQMKYMAFRTLNIPPEKTTFNRYIIALPVGITVVLCISIGIVLHFKHKAKGSFGTNSSGTEDEFASDTQGESVENRLYQSAEFQNPNTRRQGHELGNHIASSSHDNNLYPMQIDNRNIADNLGQSASVHAVRYIPQITESDLNYSEIVFEERQSSRPLVIHGIDERTIYSDIVAGAQLSNIVPNNDSSSESEDDFMYVDGFENYTERRKMNASLK